MILKAIRHNICHKVVFRFSQNIYDVVVIGGGHAGCEAAYAASRTNAKTILLTQKKSTIGEMSCNPSMGGIGKGHLIREIDALGGLVGKISDISALQFKVLNQSKGEAVKGPRAQIDRDLYKKNIQIQLEATPNLTIQQITVQDIQVDDINKEILFVKGVNGQEIKGKKFIITTGTFLKGMIHIGRISYPAGRHLRDSADVEPPSIGLANTLRRLNFPVNRVTTGTPPRLDKSTIDFSKTAIQASDDPIQPFSFVHQFDGFKPKHELINCYRTETNSQTHKVIENNKHLLPIFQGNGGKGQGPRYCPAIQKKVIRFPEKQSHQVWLEPEGIHSNVVYPNGLNNGFPEQVQIQLVRTIKGLENVKMIRPGYAVQYDYINPTHLKHTLQSTILLNLYLAGQINGTTGYEQAASQGIIAGLNAGLSSQNKDEYTIDRTKGYIGVLIDDLITQGITQPYRIFTSRSQYRLLLSASNADLRLTSDAIKMGIISQKQTNVFKQKVELRRRALISLQFHRHSLKQWLHYLPQYSKELVIKGQSKSAGQMISTFAFIKITDFPWIQGIDPRIHKPLQSQLKYKVYTTKMQAEIRNMKKNQEFSDISMIPYEKYKAQFTLEEYDLLTKNKPKTIHAASRIPGIRPTTLLYLNYLCNKYLVRQAIVQQQ